MERLTSAGDTKVHAYVTARVQGLGCSFHPDVAQHEMLGRELAAEIRAVVAP